MLQIVKILKNAHASSTDPAYKNKTFLINFRCLGFFRFGLRPLF